jgi:hypothetical protein
MKQNSMAHLIFIVVLAGWHNLLLSTRIATGKLDLHAGPDEQDQQPLRSAALLNIFVKSKKTTWESPAAVSAYIKECNSSFPCDNPICAKILFWEEDYILDNKTESEPPPGWWKLEVFPRYTEFYDNPKAPLPPPAPNISPSCHPHQPPPNRALLLVDTQIPQQRETTPQMGGGHIHTTEQRTTKSTVQLANPPPPRAPNIHPPTTATPMDLLRSIA